jgi:type II restriction enzyme
MITNKEKAVLLKIESAYYMVPILKKLNKHIKDGGIKVVLDNLYYILTESKDEVELLLDMRLKAGLIKNKDQARKSIVGSAFSNCIEYLFLKAKDSGIIKQNIFITSQTKSKLFIEMATISVDGETQKPDMDIVIWSGSEEIVDNCILISLKTSLRERAGQTYKWKLLLEIATSKNSIKDKYNISYKSSKMPIVCFATVNFYNEINNPQHKGMFKFFDGSFIGKPIDQDFISRLSSLIDFANEKLS